MTTAYKAETKLNENIDAGCGWTSDMEYSFEWMLNEYLSEVKEVDIRRKTIDFKDGSLIVFKEGMTGYYTQSQDERY